MTRTLKLAVAMAASFLSAIQPVQAATSLGRTLSRANCMVALPDITPELLRVPGLTFYESVTWDPAFWRDHVVFQGSELLSMVYLSPVEPATQVIQLAYHTPGDAFEVTRGWRHWAGQVDTGDTRMPFQARGIPFKVVYGDHFELLDNESEWFYRSTFALDCNLMAW